VCGSGFAYFVETKCHHKDSKITILNNYSIVIYIKMDYHYSSLQCHMIIQKYFLLMLKTIVLIHIFVETMIRFLFRTL